MTYREFLERKIDIAPLSGIEIDPAEVSPVLKDHQRVSVLWALRGGRRGIFARFGLGKTIMQLEWCRLLQKHAGGQVLIVMPLNVLPEFKADAVNLLGMAEPPYCRTMAEVEASGAPIVLTNYERVRDGDIDPHRFTAVSLDEAATLRSFGSKTYQSFMQKFKGVKYKLTNTATPSPNRYKELIHYAGAAYDRSRCRPCRSDRGHCGIDRRLFQQKEHFHPERRLFRQRLRRFRRRH